MCYGWSEELPTEMLNRHADERAKSSADWSPEERAARVAKQVALIEAEEQAHSHDRTIGGGRTR